MVQQGLVFQATQVKEETVMLHSLNNLAVVVVAVVVPMAGLRVLVALLHQAVFRGRVGMEGPLEEEVVEVVVLATLLTPLTMA
jgi:hypothetical protein